MIPVSNKIERSAVVRASAKEVWAKAFATPEAMAGWFAMKIEGEFKVGENFSLWFVEDDEETEHRCGCKLTAFDAGSCFEFLWHPGVSEDLAKFPESEATSVRFTLEALSDTQTKILMVESGFSRVPKKRKQFAFEANSTGWNVEFGKLKNFFN
jgi:uncharacterized protein YndB with AHSA1/START domain